MTHDSPNIWAPGAEPPLARDFYHGVLDALPTPVMVVDDEGMVVYGNAAMGAVVNLSVERATGTSLMSYVHPEDLAWVGDVFLTLTTAPPARPVPSAWASATVRLITADDEVVAVEVTGTDRLSDESINGVVYHVRPLASQAIERRVVRGMTTGVPTADLLADIVAAVGLPPLDLETAIVSISRDGSFEVFASTHGDLRALLGGARLSAGDLAEAGQSSNVEAFAAADIDGDLGVGLSAAGFVTCWQLPIRSNNMLEPHLVAGSRQHHASDAGIGERLATAADLAAMVLAGRSDLAPLS